MQSFQDRILKVANEYLKEKYGYDFYYDLVGSASRGLVTERISGNKGYDFDYNLEIDEPPILLRSVIDISMNDYKYITEAKRIKEQFREAFNYAVEGTEFEFPEDSSSVLTIKCVDKKNSRILYSADLAIVYYDNNGVLHTLEHYKSRDPWNNDGYGFQAREKSYDIDDKLEEITVFLDDGQELVREKYLELKNNNEDPDKKSFILYVEAVNDIYNEYEQDIYDEKDRQGYFD